MRKQTKVVLAAALFTLGASFSAFAAKSGTWMLEEDGWYCYDKEGDAYEDEFCLSYGKEYYMGDDGLMVTSSWVEYEDAYYYVGSDGSKTINDWRFVTPEDDEEADEAWFYFGSTGKRTSGKKVVDGKTYYFDADGKMLTGWVDYDSEDNIATEAGETVDGTLIRCDESGARMANAWVETYEPGVEEEDEDDNDPYWYWIKSKGTVATGRVRDINGETYFFDNDGKMLSGWVITTDAENYSEFEGTINNEAANDDYAVYFCGDSDQGWAKKNKWIKTWAPADFEDADADVDQYWYWIAKNGKVYVPTVASDAECMTFADGSADVPFTATASDATGYATKEINDKMYAFNTAGQMLDGLVLVEDTDMYYFGDSDDGAMKTGSVTIEDEEGESFKFYFGKKTEKGYKEGVGVNGAASGELYKQGLIQKADDSYAMITIEGVGTFVVDEDGDIRTAEKDYENSDDEPLFSTKGCDFVTEAGNKKGSIK